MVEGERGMGEARRLSSAGQIPHGAGDEIVWLGRGVSAGFRTIGRGTFTAAPATDHVLLVHFGLPAQVACRIDNQFRNGPQLPGDIDLIPAGSIGCWDAEQPTTALHFRFTQASLRMTATDLGLDPETVELSMQLRVRDSQIEHIAAAIDDALVSEMPLDRLYCDSLATALLARIVNRFVVVTPAKPKPGLSKLQLQSVIDHIEAHADDPLPLPDLAAVAGMGVSHFRVLFQRSMGISVHQYVIQRRVERAKRLLLQGRSITQSAVEAGFADQSHLARTMRRVLGIRPMEVLRLAGRATDLRPSGSPRSRG
jgi:AraC family transcriptional regulator